MNAKPFDLAIVGGGVIGLTLAWRAAEEGLSVAVCERGQMGREASWAGAGMLPAGATLPTEDAIEQLRTYSHTLHQEWAPLLHELTGIDTGYRRCGGLYLARSPAELATLSAQQLWWEMLGITYEHWSRAQVIEQLPSIGSDSDASWCEGWWVPNDAQLRNPRHLQALIRACQMRGVHLFEECEVTDWEGSGSRIVAIKTSQGKIIASRFCLAGGAWSRSLASRLGIALEVYPVRGQMILFRLPKPAFSMTLHEGHRYLVPREDGLVLAGSCEEEVGFERGTTSDMIHQLQTWSIDLLPLLKQAEIEASWSGFRPATVDGFPYLGKAPGLDNLYLSTGHFRHGLHWSTASAALLLDQIHGRPTPISLQPFAIQRGK